MKYADIKQLPQAHYAVDVGMGYVLEHLESWDQEDRTPLEMIPDFQRGHVWSKDQQSSFVEWLMVGGESGRDVYFNCPSWRTKYNTPIVCVDGLQRLTAITEFIKGNVKAFGCYSNEFEDIRKFYRFQTMRFHVATLQTKDEVLRWYVSMNTGGTDHTQQEIDRVKAMIGKGETNGK